MASKSGRCCREVEISLQDVFKTNGGRFQGWGTSLCWWANRLGYSDRLSQQAAELFFGTAGLRLNIMRYNIGGGDDPAHRHITRSDSAMPGWMAWDEKSGRFIYQDEADYRQLNVLRRAAKAAGASAYVEAFSNSPPYFMTRSGCSSGNTDAGSDNLKEGCAAEFARYLAHAVQHIEGSMGIKVQSISPMNEPNSDFWHAGSAKQEGCHFDAGQSQSEILLETAKAFADAGLSKLEVVGSDETNPHSQLIAYAAYSEEARAAIGRVNTHTYQTQDIEKLGALAAQKGFNLWMSEVDGDGIAGENAGEMGAALWLAQKIIADMNALSPAAWVLWQVIDSHISAKGMNGNADTGMVDAGGGYWGVAVADHDREKILLTQKYYGFGQFTRYIRPGSRLIRCGEDVLAAYHSDSGRLTVVAVNADAGDKPVDFTLSGMQTSAGPVRAIRTSGGLKTGESWAELMAIPTHAGGFFATLTGNSITTFLLSGVSPEEGEGL